jgi:1-acyl-sn-glycerol-3-phosphate acyltransferase
MDVSSRFWAKALATFTGNLFLLVGSVLLGVISTLVSWIPPRGNWSFGVSRIWGRLLLTASWVRVEARYDAALDPGASYVFLANHQSMFDIPALFVTVPGQIRMFAKRSLFRVPIFGWAMAAGGFIPVDRGDRSTARESFAAAVARLRGGTSILLFPEGTRSTGDTLLPFERGGFLLAMKSGLPIVPVGIRGARAIQHKGNWAIRPGKVTVSFGAPIDPATFGVRRKSELIAEVRHQVATLAGLSLPEETEVAEPPE